MAPRLLLTGVALLALCASGTQAFFWSFDGTSTKTNLQGGVNGGTGCAVCTLGVGIVEQLTEIHNESAIEAVERLCQMLPSNETAKCQELVKVLGPTVIDLIEQKYTADVVCKAIGVCTGDCRLFPAPAEGMAQSVARARASLPFGRLAAVQDLPAICDLPLLKDVCDIIYNWANNHEPLDDLDQDGFSPLHTLRGADWRGKDCDDTNKDVRPGRRPIDSDANLDSNCNGIFGIDPTTNKAYEDLFCADTPHYGIAVLGDSASAHFHLQPQYLNTTAYSNTTFDRLLFSIENEFDWPMMSASTAFAGPNDFAPDISGPDNSTYMVARNRNRCIHRDFQNIAVNGARAGSMNSTIVKTLARNQQEDYPLFVVYALIGNDVCNGHEDTLSHMTTPADMYAQAMGALEQLEHTLPNGSHVFFMGLADGSILYDTMANRTHPIGALHNDVKTKDVYAFLNCLQISPCRGWMNSNETLRALTTDHANLLSSVLENITKTQTFSNFDLHYFPNPLTEAIKEFVAAGGQAWQLIEPVDGFHPSQLAQPLITDQLWKFLSANFSDIMQPINPHNADIDKVFGDQGGH
ncbi:uncharacterized protein MONBRDRAFT_34989 [Monosiga brevicollis MX1]|uniref:Saposin B-type domain-containing protein n=1 Tax=Monosiga brevicollis TaxID=81824 RepID=A9UTM7_MONBE|nr:uncharacterized protein MONBRDRAFT_34989 [Monosiga brevicollis MX1]EDQ91273.1 predicted protein [Monosiga brevicollis MX1]|eukprot:XP_001743695.1 hypothetical protein [Monosiga brevicollis MX1]